MNLKQIAISTLAMAMFACGTASKAESKENSTINTQTNTPDPATVQNLQQSQLAEKIADTNVILIDVRTAAEVAEGYIAGAKMFLDVNATNFSSSIANLDKSKTYVVYCRSGARSARAAQQMVDSGYSQVFNLLGGIMGYNGPMGK